MNIMIVDDEPFFLEEIKRIINRIRNETGIEFQVVEEAYSGEQALEILSRRLPDILFTDIRMSAMNGLELSKIIHERWPALPVVIISGYPSFDYAREALRCHVADYILKPIDSGSVRDLLLKLNAQIQQQDYEEMQTWLSRFVLLDRADHIAQWMDLMPEPSLNFAMYVIRTPEPAFYTEKWVKELRHSRLAQNVWLCPSARKRDLVVLVSVRDNRQQHLQAISEKMKAALTEAEFPYWIVFTSGMIAVQEIHSTLSRITHALDRTAVIDRSFVDVFDVQDSGSNNLQLLTETIEQHLSLLISKSDFTALRREMTRLFSDWKKAGCPTMVVEQNGKQILRILGKLRGWDPSFLTLTEEKWAETLYGVATFEEAEASFWQLVVPFFSEDAENASLQRESVVLFNRITAYLHSNYQHPLRIEDLIEEFNMSKTTLYYLFRDHGETTFIEYITQIRMEHAKTWIERHPDMKLKDIAEHVGYADHHYFSRVFKSTTGHTPTEYKNQFIGTP